MRQKRAKGGKRKEKKTKFKRTKVKTNKGEPRKLNHKNNRNGNMSRSINTVKTSHGKKKLLKGQTNKRLGDNQLRRRLVKIFICKWENVERKKGTEGHACWQRAKSSLHQETKGGRKIKKKGVQESSSPNTKKS